MTKSKLTILLVEDDDVAAEAVERSLRKHEVGFPILWAEDGREAIEILRGEHREKKLSGSVIILLDLNMPGMNGFEFLRELRGDPRLRENIVFVLTTSDSDTDRSRAYHENIAGYMVKSAVGPQFSKLAQLLQDYQTTIKLP